ncbi:hypothetical protein GCM10009547_35710 [Sporichthya brevicatena]|uniref:Uncharacterized protein n=1 Tax=Sporichthya brevicatena TaxID=171442 RepID=A0ABP3S8C1_9ACTN
MVTASVILEDDYSHPRARDPLWRESAWFTISVPERKLHGFICVDLRPRLRTASTGVVLYEPVGEEVYDCVHYDWVERPAVDVEAALFEFSKPDNLAVRCVEPGNRYRITYDRNDVELDVEFNGLAPVVTSPFEPGSDGWGSGQDEQPGRMTGVLWIRGEKHSISCVSSRGRMWGVRDYRRRSWAEFPRHDRPWFNDGAGRAMSMYTVPTREPERDFVHYASDRLLSGWFHDGVRTAALVRGDRKVLERRRDGVATVVAIEGEDELGRRFAAEGRRVALLKWSGLPGLIAFPALYEWQLDSGDQVWGGTCEVFPADFFRQFVRRSRGRY